MKLFVATNEFQGQRKNDFNWCKEGEIVHFAVECDGETVDGSCGCKRSMSGLETLKATTTMKVVEVPITQAEFIDRLKAHYVNGWKMDEEKAYQFAEGEAKDLIRLAGNLPAFSVWEKRAERFNRRELKGRQKLCPECGRIFDPNIRTRTGYHFDGNKKICVECGRIKAELRQSFIDAGKKVGVEYSPEQLLAMTDDLFQAVKEGKVTLPGKVTHLIFWP